MVAFTILAGGYEAFIAAYCFNTSSSSLSILNKFPTGPAPSWVALHPTNQSILYAVNEDTNGALQSFEIGPQANVSGAISTISSGGNGPAFAASLSTGEVGVFNFGSGNGRILPTTTSPLFFDDKAPLISFLKPVEPKKSNPHQIVEHGGEFYVPDLGGDKIWRLARTGGPGQYEIKGSIVQLANSGPRHIAILNDSLFTLHETSSTLTVQSLSAAIQNSSSNTIASISTIPSNPPSGASFAAAEILIPPQTTRFPSTLIYVSNRNTGTQDKNGDTIAIFEHMNVGKADENLVLINQISTGLNQPRGMSIGPEKEGADEFLVAAGVQGSAGVVIFKRTEGGKNLEFVAENNEVATRSSFVWLSQNTTTRQSSSPLNQHSGYSSSSISVFQRNGNFLLDKGRILIFSLLSIYISFVYT